LNRMYRVGLTGGIGSGKTTVTRMFEELGARVIDADIIVRDLSATGRPAYQAIVQLFGPQAVDDTLALRRQYIRQTVFANMELKAKLEAILHPLVRTEIENRILENSHTYCIISIPLLFESNSAYNIDRVLVVDATEETQIARASTRDGVGHTAIEKIINNQINRKLRLAQADDVINNNSDIATLQLQVKKLHQKYLNLAADN